ncbi:MAG TPA: saccharopine dehydrogenase C-terminal domain-containing protein [Puia sp.]|uniref:saccharopine dehydrogenase C-terminal domain-containing protein n=1 Tax=Puia sp. TaxID=2045100 RepID=UPI002BBAC93B|nr:saccharopine dehydrogenase C-terminal domain-containing protein [Puia sp.]HVU96190.1 saccharopine dehydrogenase C-terminal domain-containing protein [Puia sp.]
MKRILLFGAGKSATSLIRYLLNITASRGWQLVVAESNLALAESKIAGHPQASAVAADVTHEESRDTLVSAADLVISLLPPALHFRVALSCLKRGKHLLTASYLDDPIRALEPQICEKGLFFLCEMGLDPGIDHMSALQLIRDIEAKGGRIHSFHSHTGGLVAPESDDNPWHYKISWNPRNVVLAGSAGARYRKDGSVVTTDYASLFERPGSVQVPGVGELAWYPNRDSLPYIPLYGLEPTRTFIRTTLRYPAYCRGWAALVSAGLTDDKTPIDAQGLSFADWSAPLRPFVHPSIAKQLEFLGCFDPGPVPASARTNADILQFLLETRLAMNPADKDMIVMIHELGFERNGGAFAAKSTLVVKGEDSLHTAMARTVGLPLGIAAVLVLEGRITLRGLHIPILPAIYEPVMAELQRQGIRFEHSVTPA